MPRPIVDRARAAAGRWLLLGVCSACAAASGGRAEPAAVDLAPAPGPEAAAPSADGSALALLADGFASRYPRRVQLASFERARLEVGGPEIVNHKPSEPFFGDAAMVVVDESGDWARIVSEDHGLRLLLWVGRDQLRAVVIRREQLRRSPTDSGAPGEGIVVYPGLALDLHEQRQGLTRVVYDEDGVSFSGWLPNAAVDYVYRSGKAPSEREHDIAVRAGTDVVRRDGTTIASLTEDTSMQRIGTAIGGRQRVAMRRLETSTRPAERGALELDGWIDAQAVGGPARQLGGLWGTEIGELAASNARRVPRGTLLHASPEGPVIGLTVAQPPAGYEPAERGFTALRMMTPWGATTFFARLDRAAP
jgi:hypothetical protein